MLRHLRFGLAACLAMATSASAQLIVGQDNANVPVYHVDVITGVATPLFTPADSGITAGGPNGLAVDVATGTIYWTDSDVLYRARFYDYDPNNPGRIRTEAIGQTRLGGGGLQIFDGLTFANGVLYGSDAFHSTTGAGPEGFYSIDLNTLESTLLVDLTATNSGWDFRGLGYNPTDGLFYACNNTLSPNGRGVYSVDILGTGTITLLTAYSGFAGEGNDVDGIAVGDDVLYQTIDQAGDFGVYDMIALGYLAPISPNPFGVTQSTAGGDWGGTAVLTPPPGTNLGVFTSVNPPDNLDAEVGAVLTYTIQVMNFGPDPATGVVMTANVTGDAGFNIDDITAPYVESPPGTITANIGNLGVLDSVTIFVQITTTSEGNLVFSTSVTGAESDGFLGNNEDGTDTLVRVFPELEGVFSEIASHPSSDVPGLSGKFTSIQRPWRSPDGTDLAFMAGTNIAPSTQDSVIAHSVDGTWSIAVQETVSTLSNGGPVTFFFTDAKLGLTNDGRLGFTGDDSFAATSADEVIVISDGATNTAIVREGDQILALAPNTYTFGSTLDSVNLTTNGDAWFRASSLSGGIPSAENAGVFGASGGIKVAQKGVDTPVGASNAWENFDSDLFYVDATAMNWLAQGDTSAGTTADDLLVVNGTAVIQEGQILAGTDFLTPVAAPSTTAGIIFPEMMSNGDWYCRGTNTDAEEDWVLKGNGASFSVIARLGDEITPGAGEHWDDATGNASDSFAPTFQFVAGNNQGDYVVAGRTDNIDTRVNTVLVINGQTVVARENDPVDLDGNGIFDDGAYIRTISTDAAVLTDGGLLYFMADLRADGTRGLSGSGTSIGEALVVLPVPVTPPPPGADMTIGVTSTPELVTRVGDNVTYTITVCNLGLDTATDVVVTNSLPAEIDFVSATAPLAEFPPGSGNVTGSIASMNASDCVVLEVVGQTTAEGSFLNEVGVEANEDDPAPGNNVASAATEVDDHADISVTKFDSGGSAPNGQFTYTVRVVNNGPAEATNVTFIDSLPPEVTFVSATNGAAETFPGSGVVTATLASVPATGIRNFVITVQAPNFETTVFNSVEASSDDTDPNLDNNTDTISTDIGFGADTQLTIVNEGPVRVGDNVVFTVTIFNDGPNVATNVTFQSQLPAEFTFVSAENGPFENPPGSGLVEASIPSLNALATRTMTVVAQSSIEGTFDYVATVFQNEGDPDPFNNTVTASSRVGSFSDVRVIHCEVIGHPKSVVPGALGDGGAAVDAVFDTIFDLTGSWGGHKWLLRGDTDQASTASMVLLVGEGQVGSVWAQENQPVHGGTGELYDFFDSGVLGGFNDNGDFAYSARAKAGVSGTLEKIIKVINGVGSISLQQGDPVTVIADHPSNTFGDEQLGNSVGGVHLLNNERAGYTVTPIQNCHSSFYPAAFYDTIAFLQSGASAIEGGVWDNFSLGDFRTTPDGLHYFAIGDDDNVDTTIDGILVVDDAVRIREGQALGFGLVSTITSADMAANGDWFARGSYQAPGGVWAVRNGTLVASTGDLITPTSADTWGTSFLGFTGNSQGDWILVGTTAGADPASDTVIVYNGTHVIARENDPVDLDENGKFDDDAYIGRGNNALGAFGADDVFLTEDGVVYILTTLRDGAGNDLGVAGGDAFVAINLSSVVKGACCTDGVCTEVTEPECYGFVCNVRTYLPGSFNDCYGDADGNGVVNAADRGFISANVGASDDVSVCLYDMDGNGVVNAADRGFVSATIGLCVALPDFQDGSGLNGGSPDPRFAHGEYQGVGTECASVVCP